MDALQWQVLLAAEHQVWQLDRLSGHLSLPQSSAGVPAGFLKCELQLQCETHPFALLFFFSPSFLFEFSISSLCKIVGLEAVLLVSHSYWRHFLHGEADICSSLFLEFSVSDSLQLAGGSWWLLSESE